MPRSRFQRSPTSFVVSHLLRHRQTQLYGWKHILDPRTRTLLAPECSNEFRGLVLASVHHILTPAISPSAPTPRLTFHNSPPQRSPSPILSPTPPQPAPPPQSPPRPGP